MTKLEAFRKDLDEKLSKLTREEILEMFFPKPVDHRLDGLPYEEKKGRCYCKEGDTHCGSGCIDCGKPGHLRPLMFCTLTWCDECFPEAVKRSCEM